VSARSRVTGPARWWNPPGAWAERAVCATSDPDAWFPGPHDAAAMARRVCAACPVQAECLAYALDTGEEHGIWGGLDPAERAQRAEAAA
jgi:WhiB family redox-sensing transcriptional regulator